MDRSSKVVSRHHIWGRHAPHSTVDGVRKSVKVSLAVVGLVVVLVAAVVIGVLLWRPSFRLRTGVHGAWREPGNVRASRRWNSPSSNCNTRRPSMRSGLSRGISERGRIIAVATAYQESSLRNRPDGDRDSVGLFQQRPSQGWGTADEIIDPIYAAGKFYDALLDVPDWQTMPLTQAAQAVQYSAFPDAYAKWEPQATTLVRDLSGAEPLALNCAAGSHLPTSESPERPAPAGTDNATPTLTTVLAAAAAELGGITVAAVSDDGLTATVDIAVPDLDPAAAGRTLAAWALAHATGTEVTEVVVQDRHWVDHDWESTTPGGTDNQVLITVAQ